MERSVDVVLSWNPQLDHTTVGVIWDAEVLAHCFAANPGLDVIRHFVDEFYPRYCPGVVRGNVEIEKLSCLIAFSLQFRCRCARALRA